MVVFLCLFEIWRSCPFAPAGPSHLIFKSYLFFIFNLLIFPVNEVLLICLILMTFDVYADEFTHTKKIQSVS